MPADTAKRAARSKKEREALQPKPGGTWILPWGYIVFPQETGMSREWVRGPVVGVINPDLDPLKASKVRRFAVLAHAFRRWTTPTIAAIAVCGIWGVIQFPGFYTLAALACVLTVVYVVPCFIPLPSSRHVREYTVWSRPWEETEDGILALIDSLDLLSALRDSEIASDWELLSARRTVWNFLDQKNPHPADADELRSAILARVVRAAGTIGNTRSKKDRPAPTTGAGILAAVQSFQEHPHLWVNRCRWNGPLKRALRLKDAATLAPAILALDHTEIPALQTRDIRRYRRAINDYQGAWKVSDYKGAWDVCDVAARAAILADWLVAELEHRCEHNKRKPELNRLCE